MILIDPLTARRFILGRQGLWPGRRYQGVDGTDAAMRQMEYLQLDPLQIIARSQDIALYGRVLEYTPGLWEEVTYAQRDFFDWGGWLAARPMDELPHWRTVMRREVGLNGYVAAMLRQHAETIDEMRAILRERETVGNRDFKMTHRARTDHYRGRKDSAVALYYLWRIGEVMTHHREKFERVYALTEAVAPPHLIRESDAATVNRFLVRKEVAFSGLNRLTRQGETLWHAGDKAAIARHVAALRDEGELIEVKVEGWGKPYYALRDDAPLLADLSAGRVPQAWRPLGPTTTDEAVFLAPLDPVSARGRAKRLFDFDYVWEVYKPAHQRKYGYYVLPVLWGDRLVARFDSKLDRTTNTLVILSFYLEDVALAGDDAFAEALARGFGRFARFLGADGIDAAAIEERLLRERVSAEGG